uniref:Uncharacterized protein n=1 Tax=Ciona savignyi TaxID=51511 RepID=H2Z3T4_CIOSA
MTNSASRTAFAPRTRRACKNGENIFQRFVSSVRPDLPLATKIRQLMQRNRNFNLFKPSVRNLLNRQHLQTRIAATTVSLTTRAQRRTPTQRHLARSMRTLLFRIPTRTRQQRAAIYTKIQRWKKIMRILPQPLHRSATYPHPLLRDRNRGNPPCCPHVIHIRGQTSSAKHPSYPFDHPQGDFPPPPLKMWVQPRGRSTENRSPRQYPTSEIYHRSRNRKFPSKFLRCRK